MSVPVEGGGLRPPVNNCITSKNIINSTLNEQRIALKTIDTRSYLFIH